MKYFIDTEFIEGFHNPLFGKKRHFIDLISIGIVSEDGREYHAISSEYSYSDASQWVKENVIIPLYTQTVPGIQRQFVYVDNFHKQYGKANAHIIKDLREFILGEIDESKCNCGERDTCYYCSEQMKISAQDDEIEFVGYYSDYDWVLFCSLWGTMMDLPKEFPMYCRDLKQMLDELLDNKHFRPIGSADLSNLSFTERLECVKKHVDYPKQENEHDALSDAKWNRKLYDFIFSQRLWAIKTSTK